jgi:hypothetical protein
LNSGSRDCQRIPQRIARPAQRWAHPSVFGIGNVLILVLAVGIAWPVRYHLLHNWQALGILVVTAIERELSASMRDAS